MLEKSICIADAFARDNRLTIVRSEERQTLAAITGLNIEGLSVINGIELEIPRSGSGSNSDHSDVEEAEVCSAI